MSLKLITILTFFLSIKLLSNTDIANIDISQTEDEVKLMINFDVKYSGVVVRKSANSFQKVILNSAVIEKRYSKQIKKNKFISQIDILPFPNRTDIIFYVLDGVDIVSKKYENNKLLTVTVTAKNELVLGKIEPAGKSLFDSISSGYIITLIIISGLAYFLYTIREKLSARGLRNLQTPKNDANLDWLLDANQKISLKNIQPPKVDLKIKKNPDAIQQEETPISQETFKSLRNSEHTEIVFDDDINRGRIFMLNILNRKYLLLESENGEITLLDKFNKQSQEKKPVINQVDKNLDIKLETKVTEQKKISSPINSGDLKDIFKDSENIKL